MKRIETSNSRVCVCVCMCVVSKPLGKCKPKIYHRYTQKKKPKRNSNIILKRVINHMRRDQKRKITKKILKNQIQNN